MYRRTNHTWLTFALVLSAVLLVIHLYALKYYLYWHHRWLDIPMHMLGGAALGSFLMAFGTTRRTSTYFLCMLAIFVGWEVFEYIFGISTQLGGLETRAYRIDTVKDILDGLIGSCLPFVLARKTSWR